VREREQRVRLDREGARRRLDEPAAGHAAQLGRERGAALARNVLDDARRVRQVELAVGERQALGRVGPDERPGVVRARREIDAGDVEIRLEGAEAERPAPDVDDRHPRPDAGPGEEPLVTPPARVRRERAEDARPQAPASGPVDVL